MPFRAEAPFLHDITINLHQSLVLYQCPLGLVLHFYQDAIEKIYPGNSINALSG